MKTKRLLTVFLLLGCRANVQAQGSANLDANASGDVEQDGSAFAGTESPASEGEAASGDGAASVAIGEPALLGARHDLSLVLERATTKCQCLSAGLGTPDSPAFQWKAGPPQVDPHTQLVVALSSEGEKCAEPKGSLGASYWGYRQKGNDVIVFVESAGGGRPLTPGAIVPKPLADGQVYVAPASKRTPYGRAIDGGAQCKLGNPGAQRTTPAGAGETESDE